MTGLFRQTAKFSRIFCVFGMAIGLAGCAEPPASDTNADSPAHPNASDRGKGSSGGLTTGRDGAGAASSATDPAILEAGRLTRGGQIVASVRAEPQSFNAYAASDATTYLVSLLTQARLVRVNGVTQQLEPWLAERWTASDDGLRYRVMLRPDLFFSDGTAATADDVVFSIAAAYADGSALGDSVMVAGKPLQAVAVDPLTVDIVFPAPFGPGLRILNNLPILPRHKLQQAVANGTFQRAWNVSTPVTEIVGLGPFVLSEYVPGQRLTFSRNPRYFRADAAGQPLPYLDRIVVEVVPDQGAQVLRLQAAQADTTVSEVRPEDYAPLKRSADQGKLQLLDLGVAMDPDAFWMNLTPGAFAADPRRAWIQRDELRQAISLAVDRQAFADAVFLGAALPVFGPVTPANRLWYSDQVPRPTHNLALARQRLASIGLSDPDGDGRLADRAGQPARFTLLTAKGQTALERGAVVVRDELAKVGLIVDVVPLEGNALIQRFLSGRDYDAVYFHLTTTDTDPASTADFWMSSGAAHVWSLNQKAPATEWERQIDLLMARQAAALDLAERQRLFVEVQKLFAEHLPMIHFAAPRVFVAASSRLTNLTPAVWRPQLLWSADTLALRR